MNKFKVDTNDISKNMMQFKSLDVVTPTVEILDHTIDEVWFKCMMHQWKQKHYVFVIGIHFITLATDDITFENGNFEDNLIKIQCLV